MIEHYLLTRFNVSVFETANNQSFKSFFGKSIGMAPDEWMRRRLSIFERYCLPSVANQTDRAFVWLIMIDPMTPPQYWDILERVIDSAGLRFELVPIARQFVYLPQYDGKAVGGACIDPIVEHIHEATNGDWVVTTRLDSDDMICRDFMASIRNMASKQTKRCIIDYPNGHYMKPPDRIAEHNYPHGSPFCSVVEPIASEIDTVLRLQHTDIGMIGPIKTISKRGWVHVVHGLNAAGKTIAGDQIMDETHLASEFGYKAETV